MTMSEKEQIELHVSKLFIARNIEVSVDDAELKFGDSHKSEPDILYQGIGIEIGAVLKGTNTNIDHYEDKFLAAASDAIDGKIPSYYQIRLVMQDDSETVRHTPTPNFEKYSTLPKYLDGIFVLRHGSSSDHQKIVLNQKTRMRTPTFPKNTTGREFKKFVIELADFILSLSDSDFSGQNGNKLHHSFVTNGEVLSNKNPLDDFLSPKIVDKLSKDKYKGDYDKKILLLHNYSIAGNTSFTSDIHFYSHHRNDIFNLIYDLIKGHNSFDYYDGIFFLDFSSYAGNSNFNLIDFSSYSPLEPSKFLHGFEEIRVDLGSIIPNDK